MSNKQMLTGLLILGGLGVVLYLVKKKKKTVSAAAPAPAPTSKPVTGALMTFVQSSADGGGGGSSTGTPKGSTVLSSSAM